MLLCCGWNRRREKFGLLHIVCKTVQLRAFFERRDQLVSGEQTTQFWCNLQKKTDKKNYSNNSILKCLFDNSGRNRKVLLVSSQNRLLSRSGDNGGIVDVYLPGLVIEHSCSFFDTSNRHSKVYSILVYISLDGTNSGRDSKITT